MAKLPDSEKKPFYLGQKTLSEEESIRHAIAMLDCPEGAEMYFAQYWKPNFFDKKTTLSPLSEKELRPVINKLSLLRYPKQFFRDDRFDLLAKHADPQFRLAALAVIQNIPKPRYVRMLSALLNDPDPVVKKEATKVTSFFINIL